MRSSDRLAHPGRRALPLAGLAAVLLLSASSALAGPHRCGPISKEGAARALATLVSAVRATLPEGAEVRVEEVVWRGCRRLPTRFHRMEVVPSLGRTVGPRESAHVRLVDRRGRLLARARLTASLAIRTPTVVVTRTVPAGTTLKAGDLRVELLPRESSRSGRPSSPASVVGLKAACTIAEGTPLQRSLLERPVLIRKGAVVRALVRGPGLVVTAHGIAAQNGRLGDVIRLTSLDGERRFRGRVAAKNHVEVEP